MHGFHKLLRHEHLFGKLPDWCGATDALDHARWCFDPATVLFTIGGMNVTLGGVAAAASIAGGVIGAAGAAQSGRAQQDMSNYQAAVMQQQAERERQQSEADATELRNRNQRLMARQRTLYSASGVTREGTPLLVEEDTAAEAELEALKVLSGGQVRATRLEQQAGLERFSGRVARQQGYARGGALLLSGVGGAFS